MSSGFVLVVEATDVAIPPMTPQRAARAFVHGLGSDFAGYHPLVAGSRIHCRLGVSERAVDPSDAIPGVRTSASFFTVGWGPKHDEEAFLYLLRRSDGSIVWRAAFDSLAGFER